MKQSQSPAKRTTLIWDIGTAYELFVSLHVLHEPEFYGLRPAWAAGIRSRISLPERTFLEEVVPFLGLAEKQLRWIYRLPQPKDARSVFHALQNTPPDKRGIALLGLEASDQPEAKRLLEIAKRRAWDKEDLAELTPIFCSEEPLHSAEELVRFLDRWQHPDDFGKMLLLALEAYHQAFFEKEEKRIWPVLQAGLQHARDLSKRLEPSELITELSQGYKVTGAIGKHLIVVPNFWATPMICLEKVGTDETLFLFGARPPTMSAIPGEQVPDGLLRRLKALSDPTRLTILRYLSQEDLGPTELARRLDLRGPTIIHHLRELRLAGLVNFTVEGQEKRYQTRLEAIDDTHVDLKRFITNIAGDEPSAAKRHPT
jgi:DNA-binding transcriptional ArsR family regulator